MAGETAVVQMVNLIFAQAVRDSASDIHIEPYERNMKVRYRVDGMLREVMEPPKRMHSAIISRLKILGEMNIAERRLPQDGTHQAGHRRTQRRCPRQHPPNCFRRAPP